MTTSRLITRRRALLAGLAPVGGALLPGVLSKMPPTYGHILRMGDDLTYAAHRLLLPGDALVARVQPGRDHVLPGNRHDQSRRHEVPLSGASRELQRAAFAGWRLSVREGRVARPGAFSLADLKAFAARTQITRHTCEEGWSAIAEWTGVPLGLILDAAGDSSDGAVRCFLFV